MRDLPAPPEVQRDLRLLRQEPPAQRHPPLHRFLEDRGFECISLPLHQPRQAGQDVNRFRIQAGELVVVVASHGKDIGLLQESHDTSGTPAAVDEVSDADDAVGAAVEPNLAHGGQHAVECAMNVADQEVPTSLIAGETQHHFLGQSGIDLCGSQDGFSYWAQPRGRGRSPASSFSSRTACN